MEIPETYYNYMYLFKSGESIYFSHSSPKFELKGRTISKNVIEINDAFCPIHKREVVVQINLEETVAMTCEKIEKKKDDKEKRNN